MDNSRILELVTGLEEEPSFLSGLAPDRDAEREAETMGESGPEAAVREHGPPEIEQVEASEHKVAIEDAVETAIETQAVQQSTPPAREAPSTVAATEPAAKASTEVKEPEKPKVSTAATKAGGKGSRGLTEAEIEYAKRIYGDAIDYSKVRMTSDHWLSIGAPKCIGNTMHMRSEWGGKNFNEDGTLTNAGRDLLIHEIGHVWQFQNGGAAYIPESLWSQFKGWVSGESRNAAYDYETVMAEGVPWKEWNPEQQATAIEDYNELLVREEKGQWMSESMKAKMAEIEPYVDKARNREGAVQFSGVGATVGAGVGATIGFFVGGPVGAAVGGLLGGWLGGG